MPDHDSLPLPEGAPAWLDATTPRAMRAARDRVLSAGEGRAAAVDAARAIARAHRPALPATMIAEAVDVVVPAAAAAPPARTALDEAALRRGAREEFAACCRAAARAAHHLVMARLRAGRHAAHPH